VIPVHEIRIGAVYEVTHDAQENEDDGTIIVAVSVVKIHAHSRFSFLWLNGEYEGQVVEGSDVTFNTMMPFKEIA
jgi:hypothetical protein